MDLNAQLEQLRQALDAGNLTQAEYDRLKAGAVARFGGGAAHAPYRPTDQTRLANLCEGLEIGPADDRYRLVRRIGGGGMGHVWLAHDLNLEARRGGERLKALKVIHPQLQDQRPALERLKDEADRAAALNHENIVNVLGWRQGGDGWLFVIMEYLPGRDLDEYLHEQGGQGLAADDIRRILPPMARALDHAHAHQVLHRDLKPANVFLTEAGEIKLLDFGLAAELHSSASSLELSDTSGTCEYMSPQAHHGAAPGVADDIYALACVTCQLLTGRPPLTCMAAVNRGPGPLPKPDERLGDPVWAVLQQGLAYAPGERPANAGAFGKAFLAALDPKKQVEPEAPEPTRWWPGALVALALGGGVMLWQPWKAPAPDDPAVARDAQRWQEARRLNTSEGYQAYRDQCERCARDEAAEQAIARLRAEAKLRELAEERKNRQKPEQVKVWTEPYTGMQFVWVPGGTFGMGSEEGDSDEKPPHPVRLDGFWLGKYEVTQGQWKKVMGENPSKFQKGDDYPVEQVSWNAVQTFIKKLSTATGSRYGFSLPSEAQWEYACRSGGKDQVYAGFDGEGELDRYANICDKNCTYDWADKALDDRYKTTAPVGSYRPNGLGLYDMSGNVWEWVQDWYEGNIYGIYAKQGTVENPIYAEGGLYPAARGFGWDGSASFVRCASRGFWHPDHRSGGLGFRLQRTH